MYGTDKQTAFHSIIEYIELKHHLLKLKIKGFFDGLSAVQTAPVTPPLFLMKDYIKESKMDFSMSISNTVSKGTAGEEMSFFVSYLEDEASHLTDGIKHETISNEKIQKGDIVLDTYQVTSDAIHGGMGSVWRVHHKIWDVDLAMKRPQPKFFAEGSGRRKEEFIEECQHWIDLGLHPNVVTCYYVRDIGGVPTIFSEWMDGGSLKDRILEGSLYEGTESDIQTRILDIAIQTARGLRYSHDNGLVHQDIKPGNILVSKEWDAKIADFGLAKAQKKLEDELCSGTLSVEELTEKSKRLPSLKDELDEKSMRWLELSELC